MPAFSRCLASALGLFAAGASGFSVSDLSRKNYDSPGMDNLWGIGLTASGYELGASAGRTGDYKQPTRASLDYFHKQGSNTFRVPITWERLQSSLGTTELDLVFGFEETIRYITEELEANAIIVPYEGVGGGLRYDGQNANITDFVNLWTAISNNFKSNNRVIFELYRFPEYGCHNGNCGSGPGGGFFLSRPNDEDGEEVEAWQEWCQQALDAIRNQGADNYVLVPGLKFSRCRDWSGGNYWGAPLDNLAASGNLRLFAINDTAERTAYSVHQYFDGTLTGTDAGCTGHTYYELAPSAPAADQGLVQTINMAQKYNKKLWLTEVASYPDPAATATERTDCEKKMGDYLATMADSGVFLGYQVMQFGCKDCATGSDGTTDLWTMPDAKYNLDWYDLDMYQPTTTSTTVTTSTRTTSTRTTSTATTTTCTGSACTTTATTTTTTSTVTEAPDVTLSGAASILPGAGLLAAAAAAALAQLPA